MDTGDASELDERRYEFGCDRESSLLCCTAWSEVKGNIADQVDCIEQLPEM